MNDSGSRFKRLREVRHLSQQEAAEAFEVGISSWNRFERNDLPRGETLLAIAQSGISVDWLLTGEGSMFRNDKNSNPLLADEDFVSYAILASIDTLDKMRGPVSPAAFRQIFLDMLEEGMVTEAEMTVEEALTGYKAPPKEKEDIKELFHKQLGFKPREMSIPLRGAGKLIPKNDH